MEGLTITTPSVWGIIQYILAVLAVVVFFLQKRSIDSRDETIKQLHVDIRSSVDRLNLLSDKILVVETEHETGFPGHMDCTKRLTILETKVDACEKRKGVK
jgi:hypothetical protein